MRKTLNFTSPAMPQLLGFSALELRRIEGEERLSSLYRYNLELATPDGLGTPLMAANVDFKSLVGKEVTVTIELEGSGTFAAGMAGGAGVNVGAGKREISGIVSEARFLRIEDRRGIYQVVVEPWLTLAARSSDFRVFQGMNVMEVIKAVLGGYSGGIATANKPGYPFSLLNHTSEAYPVKDFWVQYGETDFAFVSRLMEEWGIYYYFEHSGGVHRLVLVDAPGAHQKPDSAAYHLIRYHPPGRKIDEEHFNQVDFAESLTSGVWVSSDYDFREPKANLFKTEKMPRNTGHNQLEHFSWPNDSMNQSLATNPNDGEFISRVRLEEVGHVGIIGSAAGNLRGMNCGYVFQLKNYLQEQYDGKIYLITSSYLSISDVGGATGEGEYVCQSYISFIPANNKFRAPRVTPIPRTHGPQTAIVTGPKGREIFTDPYGRVKLSFHWNRYCTKDENASCWVRVNYPWAGNGFGAVHVPRINQEVIVDFEQGDPDRPIVTGRVYNALNMPPWQLPANQTQSGFLTRSSEGGGFANANALRFEDQKGKEEIWLHAEKDQRIEVENDESHWVGHDRTKTIDHDETNHIKNDRTETVDGHEKITVHKTRTEEVDLDETLTVHGNRTRTVDGTEIETITKDKTESLCAAHTQDVTKDKTVSVGANYVISVTKDMNDSISENKNTDVSKNYNVNTGKNIMVEAGDTITFKCGKATIKMEKNGDITINGHDFSLGTTGDQRLKADGKIMMKADKILEN